MQIIIPMSGFGERFRKAGYTTPKPLIDVEGKPIIAHVLDLFPGERDFVFICNEDHLKTTNMLDVLRKYSPTGQIVPIKAHKLGPVYAVSQAFGVINDNLPTIVNYCDFTCYWNYTQFKQWVAGNGADGCVPAYRGFHPHSLGSNNYAYMRVKDGWMQEIQEKKSFTNNKMEEYASSGTYYFAKGQYVKRFFAEAIRRNLSVNGEYYCSLVYNLMVEAGLSVATFEIEHFMQWGTPEDLAEYLRWSDAFKSLVEPIAVNTTTAGSTLIPMAGKGSRFKEAGYENPKPLILVSGEPMVIQATRSLPSTTSYHFVALTDHHDNSDLARKVHEHFPCANFTHLESVTEGQACTCLAAMNKLNPTHPLTISACDHGVIYSHERFNELMSDSEVDVIVWIARGHPGALLNPQMYGWVLTKEEHAIGVSVKHPLKDPATDPVLIGTFTFKRAEIYSQAVQRLTNRNGKVNGEYYVDSCIEDVIALGYSCRIFEVDHYLCWGTPIELKAFKYWQSCFHKWSTHPYRYQNDRWYNNSSETDLIHPSFPI